MVLIASGDRRKSATARAANAREMSSRRATTYSSAPETSVSTSIRLRASAIDQSEESSGAVSSDQPAMMSQPSGGWSYQ